MIKKQKHDHLALELLTRDDWDTFVHFLGKEAVQEVIQKDDHRKPQDRYWKKGFERGRNVPESKIQELITHCTGCKHAQFLLYSHWLNRYGHLVIQAWERTSTEHLEDDVVRLLAHQKDDERISIALYFALLMHKELRAACTPELLQELLQADSKLKQKVAIHRLQHKIEELEARNTALEEQHQSFETTLEERQQRILQLEQELTTERENALTLQQKIASLHIDQSTFNNQKQRLHELTMCVQQQQQKIEQLQKQSHDLQQKLIELQTRHQEEQELLRQELSEANDCYTITLENFEESEKELQEVKTTLQLMSQNNSEILHRARQQYEALKRQTAERDALLRGHLTEMRALLPLADRRKSIFRQYRLNQAKKLLDKIFFTLDGEQEQPSTLDPAWRQALAQLTQQLNIHPHTTTHTGSKWEDWNRWLRLESTLVEPLLASIDTPPSPHITTINKAQQLLMIRWYLLEWLREQAVFDPIEIEGEHMA
uniref:Uncharacterized protein n=1 Tax=Thermosporothrix sp. COM3 TaxID=2490863 RepID=A0A455SGV2_9CHLR|nr:hypothetical protein KTC_13020 [Thermosporothrix sp. COM3]